MSRYSAGISHNTKRDREVAFKKTLADGVQRRITTGLADCGSGNFPFLELTGFSQPII